MIRICGSLMEITFSCQNHIFSCQNHINRFFFLSRLASLWRRGKAFHRRSRVASENLTIFIGRSSRT